MKSTAGSIPEYLDSLPEDRRKVISKVRSVLNRSMPKGYEELLHWGMISWEIPLKRYPETYNKQPLCYVGLAVQKNHFSLYLMGVYMNPAQDAALRQAFASAGKKLDMGKSCIRFKKVEDLPLDAIGELVAGCTPEQYIERYETLQKKTAAR